MKKIIITLLMCAFMLCHINAQNDRIQSYCKCDTIRITQDTSDLSLIVYKPVNCILQLSCKRSATEKPNVCFAAPCAFTAKNYKEIVGRFIGNDTIIENPTEQETGLCTIDNDNIYIGDIKDSSMFYYNAIQNGDVFYFQQMLLINSGQPIECTIFGKQKPTFRRALAIKDGMPYVVESLNRMNIQEFTDIMLQQGYTDAIYMDMGTWSEGFFISENNEKITIGNLRQNTRYQTNWLLFVSK